MLEDAEPSQSMAAEIMDLLSKKSYETGHLINSIHLIAVPVARRISKSYLIFGLNYRSQQPVQSFCRVPSSSYLWKLQPFADVPALFFFFFVPPLSRLLCSCQAIDTDCQRCNKLIFQVLKDV